MEFFNGIEWVNSEHLPEYREWSEVRNPDCFTLHYVDIGRVKWIMDGQPPVTLEAPVAWWTFPGSDFSFGAENGHSLDYYSVSYRGPRVTEYVQKGLLPLHEQWFYQTMNYPVTFQNLFQKLLDTLASGVHRNRRSVYFLEGLLMALHEQNVEVPTRNRALHVIHRLEEQVGLFPMQDVDWEEYARECSQSYSHFRKQFKEVSGMSPQKFLQKSRLNKAARDLRNTDLSIKKIAGDLGYGDIYHFSKQFKKQMGVPPSQYRRESAEG